MRITDARNLFPSIRLSLDASLLASAEEALVLLKS